MMLFKTLVDSFYWGFVIQVFYIFLDAITPNSFGTEIYTLWGFFLFYWYAFLILFVLRLPDIFGNSNKINNKTDTSLENNRNRARSGSAPPLGR